MKTKSIFVPVFLAVGIVLLSSSGVEAQDGFLFGQPDVTVDLRLGRIAPSASSDIFDYLTDEFTLERSDFRASLYAADIAFRASGRLDVVLGISYARSSTRSESRDFVDENDLPIEQRTDFTRVPLTAGVRLFPLARGATLGQYAWIPSAVTPYVEAGGGLLRYSLVQAGEFVEREDLSITADRLRSAGTVLIGYGEAGVALWLTRRLGVSGAARYTVGGTDLNDDYYSGFRMDVSGLQGSAGVTMRF